MRINKLLGAFANMDKIFEGLKNKIFKREDVEKIAALRWQECARCEFLDNSGSKCAMRGTQPCCADCGCSIAVKIRSLSSGCPKGKWNAVMNKETEKKVKKQIKDKENASNI